MLNDCHHDSVACVYSASTGAGIVSKARPLIITRLIVASSYDAARDDRGRVSLAIDIVGRRHSPACCAFSMRNYAKSIKLFVYIHRSVIVFRCVSFFFFLHKDWRWVIAERIGSIVALPDHKNLHPKCALNLPKNAPVSRVAYSASLRCRSSVSSLVIKS